MKTLFEKIIQGELPAEKVYEDEKILAIKDKFPKAPVHLLIIPKEPIPDLQSVTSEQLPIIGDIFRVAQKLAEEFDVVKTGYRVLVNMGPFAGQTVHHLHFHLLGGKPLGAMG